MIANPAFSLRRLAGLSALLATASLPAQQAPTEPALANSDSIVGLEPQGANMVSAVESSASGPSVSGPSASAEILVPIHTAAADQGIAYGIWAAGTRYKISFHDGATLIPYLGREYPHNQPWSWTTASVRMGGVELVTHEPRLSYQDVRAEYDLGNVVEAWDVRAAGVEQTFVIEQRAAAGDLVVQGTVQTMLRSDAVAPGHRALSFRDGSGDELIRYGAATAIDALGNRRAMTTAFENGRVTLRLDSAWLDGATFPIVVDPIVGPGATVVGSLHYELDLVRDAETNTEPNWGARSVFASSTDADVFVQRWLDTGSLASSAFADINSGWSSRNPSMGYNASSNSAVCAFDRFFPSNNTRRMRVHRHDRNDLSLGTTVSFLGGQENVWRADVGGTRYNSAGSNVLIVYQRESTGAFFNVFNSNIFAVTYDVSSGTFGTPYAVASSTFADDERPSINQMTTDLSTNPHWVVAYQNRSVFNADDLDVIARQLDLSGTVGSSFAVDPGYTDHHFAPQLAGSQGRYLCAYVGSPLSSGVPTGTFGRDLKTTRINWPNGGSASAPHGSPTLQSSSLSNIDLGAVAFDRNSRSHWVVLMRSTTSDNISVFACGYRGITLRVDQVYGAASFNDTTIGGISFDSMNNAFSIYYAYTSILSSFSVTNRFIYPLVFSPASTGVACSNAQISWSGSQQIGSELSELRVSGAASDSIHVAVLATASANAPIANIPPIQNGCWLLVANTGSDFLGLFDIRVGANVSWSLPLPEFLPVETYYMQGWHTVGGGNFDFVSTQRLVVPTVK